VLLFSLFKRYMFRKKKHISFATSLFYRFTTPKKHSSRCAFLGRLSLHAVSRFGFVQNNSSNTRQSFVLTHSLFVLSEKVQKQPAYGAKQKFFVVET